MGGKTVVGEKPNNYQPTKAELEKPVKIEATAEEVIRRSFRQVGEIQDRVA